MAAQKKLEILLYERVLEVTGAIGRLADPKHIAHARGDRLQFEAIHWKIEE